MSLVPLIPCLFLSSLLFLADATSSPYLHHQSLDEPPTTSRGNEASDQRMRRILQLGTSGVPVEGMANPVSTVTPRARNRERKAKLAKEFLEVHNGARVSTGNPPLKWNRYLTRFAAWWAANRRPDCKMAHSSGPFGENLFWYQRKQWTPSRVVEEWVAEKKNYDPQTNTCVQGQMCGHYTQVVWRGTTMVGCARVKCDGNAGYLVVCEYYPRGNFEGESPFEDVKEKEDENGRY